MGKGGEAATKRSNALICALSSVEKLVINQQTTIDFPARSQPESSISAVTINNQRYPPAAMPLASVSRSLEDGDPELSRVMAGGD